MGYGDQLRAMFADLDPRVDDLFLLEAHQIRDLPARVSSDDLARVLRAHPQVHRFLVARCPAVSDTLASLVSDRRRSAPDELVASEQAVLWDVADMIVYQRAPEYYETNADVGWSINAVTQVMSLRNAVVIDAGAGTGRVAFDAAPLARHVLAVEPVAALRQFMRQKAVRLGIGNVFAVDGFLDAIPVPSASVDILLTCQAVGWRLSEELAEADRVVKRGGQVMHLFGAPDSEHTQQALFRALRTHGYEQSTFRDGPVALQRFYRRVGS